VLAELGRVPRAGERLLLAGYELTVEQVVRRRVGRVVVRQAGAVPVGAAEPGAVEADG
jgi:CBS domain containing-hemolysin-like protein